MIGEVIRIVRVANDMTISSLSEKSSVSCSYISEVEMGKKNPSKKIINKLDSAFNLEPGTLYEFDTLHNSSMKKKERLCAYRSFLIAVLKHYNNMEKNDVVIGEDITQTIVRK